MIKSYIAGSGDARLLGADTLNSFSLEASGEYLDEWIGAQVLRDLGVQRMRLITNNPSKIILAGYGLEVIEQVHLRKDPDDYVAI